MTHKRLIDLLWLLLVALTLGGAFLGASHIGDCSGRQAQFVLEVLSEVLANIAQQVLRGALGVEVERHDETVEVVVVVEDDGALGSTGPWCNFPFPGILL